MTDSTRRTESAFLAAQEQFAELGVDVGKAVERLKGVPISLHCWQGDDVRGFEGVHREIGGGLAVTGSYLGRARTVDELRADAEQVFKLLPGEHRFNLHASYGEFGEERTDRDAIEPTHFQGWIDWAAEKGLHLDFNPTFFAHNLAADGWTLAHADPGVRAFWVEHGRRARGISAEMGRQLGSPCITNVWIPDGSKEGPVDRCGPRERLVESLDRVFSERLDPLHVRDAVESKLFGIGSESYVAGSHEFYLGYATTREKMLCLDSGHFHPTESIADKISAVLCFVPELLLHVSRGVRWDSDHVVALSDETLAIAKEAVRGDFLDRIHFGLDFFDASINRVAAWTIGARNLLKALLISLLEPRARLHEAEATGDLTARLAYFEEDRLLPYGAVWDYYCESSIVPRDGAWQEIVRDYERRVLSLRD